MLGALVIIHNSMVDTHQIDSFLVTQKTGSSYSGLLQGLTYKLAVQCSVPSAESTDRESECTCIFLQLEGKEYGSFSFMLKHP